VVSLTSCAAETGLEKVTESGVFVDLFLEVTAERVSEVGAGREHV
jgi:hypothetical protein